MTMRQVFACLFGLSLWAMAQACLVDVVDFPAEPPSGTGGGGQGGMAEGGGASGGSAGDGTLMEACASTDDCEEDLECFTVDQQPWGFPGGACTRYCTTTAECPLGGVCADGLCTLFCDHGQSVTKCLGRENLACILIGDEGNSYGVCTPICHGDEDCPGRRCDRATGLCTNVAPTGAQGPFSTCQTPDQGADPCRGCCSAGRCFEVCRIDDQISGCNGDPSLTCHSHQNGVNGDMGFCTTTCTPGDCSPIAFVCRNGHCEPNVLAEANACNE